MPQDIKEATLFTRKQSLWRLCLEGLPYRKAVLVIARGTMGSVLGREATNALSYEVLKDAPAYEIRAYEQHLAVQTEWKGDSKSTFMSLAGYIGVFEEPQNKSGEKMAMTTPVECLADTEKFVTMRLFPPSEHTSAESMPEPLSPLISIETVPKRFVAARRFSGSVDLNRPRTDPSVKPHLLHLLRALLDNGLLKADEPCHTDESVWQQLDAGCLKDAATGETMRWSLAVYNPPFCLPFLRRNEIWVSLSPGAAQHWQSSIVTRTILKRYATANKAIARRNWKTQSLRRARCDQPYLNRHLEFIIRQHSLA